MDIEKYFDENEKPLDNIVDDGGFCAIFRKIVCIGDSLSSGEFESRGIDGKSKYNDMYEYSWGQYIGRAIGAEVLNCSKGGLTAKKYVETFAPNRNYFDKPYDAQAYTIGFGVNEINQIQRGEGIPLGDIEDIKDDYTQNADTFVGNYGKIIAKYKELQPRAKFFLITIPQGAADEERIALVARHTELIYQIAEKFTNCFVIDLNKYAPAHDKLYQERFYMSGHLNPMGYIVSAKQIMSYIDYIVRHNYAQFRKVPFIGTDLDNLKYPEE